MNKVTNVFFIIMLIAMFLFAPQVVEIIDSNRARLGYDGENKIAVDQSREFFFNSTTSPILVELLHPNLYEDAKWKEIIEVSSEFSGVGMNLSIRPNLDNEVSFKLKNNGLYKVFVESDFYILVPGDRLELRLTEGSGCVNCASLTFYDLWNFFGSQGSILVKFSLEVIDWGKNWISIILADLLLAIFVGLLWAISKKSFSRKGYTI